MSEVGSDSGARRADRRVVHLTTVHRAIDPRIFHKQLRTLRTAGYDTHLIAPHKQSETVSGIEIRSLPHVSGRYRRVALQRPIYQAAVNLGADCYHVHDPELIPLAYVLKRETGARIIYDMHEDYRWHGPVEGRLLRMVEQWGFRWIDHVVLAESSYRAILGEADVAATFIGNYMRPYDTARPASFRELRSPLRLLYTGVVAGSRGLFHMIDLVERLRTAHMRARLDLIGVCHLNEERWRAEQIIQQRNLESNVCRVGWTSYVPASTMSSYYRAADVGLALFDPDPNYVQSMPTKFFEYLHFGLPILCSDFPRWRRFIERHDCGAVVPPGDADAALQVLRCWHNHPDRYRTLSTAARAAAPQYRWQIMGERLVRLYDTLLGVTPVSE